MFRPTADFLGEKHTKKVGDETLVSDQPFPAQSVSQSDGLTRKTGKYQHALSFFFNIRETAVKYEEKKN